MVLKIASLSVYKYFLASWKKPRFTHKKVAKTVGVGIFCIEKETGSSWRGFFIKNTLAFLTGGFKEKGEVNRDVYGLLSQVDSCKKVRPTP